MPTIFGYEVTAIPDEDGKPLGLMGICQSVVLGGLALATQSSDMGIMAAVVFVLSLYGCTPHIDCSPKHSDHRLSGVEIV